MGFVLPNCSPNFLPNLRKCKNFKVSKAAVKESFLWCTAVLVLDILKIAQSIPGNGRMARLWHTAMLAKWKPVFEYIPIESQIEKFQNEYYEAIARCHVEGESTLFIEFMLSQIDKILDEVSAQVSADNEQLSEYLKRLLEVMEYDVPYTSNTLMDKLGLKSKEGFRRNYLRPAIDMNLIRMTIPDKPNSRNQRYVRE